MIFNKAEVFSKVIKKSFLILIMLSFMSKMAICSENQQEIDNKVEITFFADEQNISVGDRKKIVSFLKFHRETDFYEFEIHSLSDPLNMGLDVGRLIQVQGLFREHDVELDKLVNAKVRFISGENQRVVVIRKRSK